MKWIKRLTERLRIRYMFWRRREEIRSLVDRCNEIRDFARKAKREGYIDDVFVDLAYEPQVRAISAHVIACRNASGFGDMYDRLQQLHGMLDRLEHAVEARVALRKKAREARAN